MISKEDIKHIAYLSRLEFRDEEIDDFATKFSEVLEYVEKLAEVDTSCVEPTYGVNDIMNVFREDEVETSFDREDALKNAPDKEFGYFKLPKVID